MSTNVMGEVADIVSASPRITQYIDPNCIYVGQIPLANQRDTATTMLITNIGVKPGSYGADRIYSLMESVQIQIWFQAESDVDSFEWNLTDVLADSFFYFDYSDGNTLDEETSQIKTTIVYRRKKIMR